MQSGEPLLNVSIYHGEHGAYAAPAVGDSNVTDMISHIREDWTRFCEWKGDFHCEIAESRPTAPSPDDEFDIVRQPSVPPARQPPWIEETPTDARSKRARSCHRPRSAPPPKQTNVSVMDDVGPAQRRSTVGNTAQSDER